MDIRILYTILAIAGAYIISGALKGYLGYRIGKFLPKSAGGVPFKGLVNALFIIVFLLVILGIWGVSFANLWVFITGIAALIAIGFFAVWSMLSNLLAGLILVLRKTIQVGNEVVIMPEKIKGKVVRTGLLFVTLNDKGYDILIPNNMFFQKFIKIKRKK